MENKHRKTSETICENSEDEADDLFDLTKVDADDPKSGMVFGGLSSETRNQCLGYDIAPHLMNMMRANVRTVPYRLTKMN